MVVVVGGFAASGERFLDAPSEGVVAIGLGSARAGQRDARQTVLVIPTVARRAGRVGLARGIAVVVVGVAGV